VARLFELEILTPTERIFNGKVSSLVMPAEEGYWGILAGHMPSIAKLKEGKVRARTNEEEKEWIIKGGYAWVEREKTVLLVEL
jgi:F-type H+-transporting ATPase subunit epsilon